MTMQKLMHRKRNSFIILSNILFSHFHSKQLLCNHQKFYHKLIIIMYFYNKNMSFVFKPTWQEQGVGAKVIRVIGNKYLKRLDPFLMLDYFRTRLPAGAPDHPHRGFQTVTYLLEGTVHHEDFKGHKGTLRAGDIQWMTAGKGIVHAQMPGSYTEDSVGFQLWLNLKSKDKMQEPKYQQFSKDQIPVFQKNGAQVKIICGTWEGHTGPIKYHTPAYYMDIRLPKQGSFQISLQKTWNGIIYPYEGQMQYFFQEKSHLVSPFQCCVLEKSKENALVHKMRSKNGAGFMFAAGEPINQPVFSYGPFVMSSEKQIQQTFEDYENCKNGFEERGKWVSKIRQMSKGKKFSEL